MFAEVTVLQRQFRTFSMLRMDLVVARERTRYGDSRRGAPLKRLHGAVASCKHLTVFSSYSHLICRFVGGA